MITSQRMLSTFDLKNQTNDPSQVLEESTKTTQCSDQSFEEEIYEREEDILNVNKIIRNCKTKEPSQWSKVNVLEPKHVPLKRKYEQNISMNSDPKI